MSEDTGASVPDSASFHRYRGEVRAVIVQPKYKGKPLRKWVGKRFASLLYFDPGTFVIGAELLEAGVLIFVGPIMLALAHVKRQAAAFDMRDAAIAMEARRGETRSGSTAEGGDGAGRNGIAQTTSKEIVNG